MYFGGTNGFVRFHPDSVHDNLDVPPVFITTFKKFYKDAELDSAITEKRAVELSYRENVFSMEFAALDYIHPERNQYAYKLEGLDKEWVYCGTRREATYTSLDPGTYTFRVKGSNHDGVWNEAGASLTVIVNPAFWQTFWFKAGVALLFAAVLYTLYRYRLSRLLELQRFRLRIADDLHDEIGSELSGIALESDLIARQLQAETPQHLRLTTIGRSIRAAADNLRDVVWVVNPELDTVQDLVARMRAIASKMLAGHQVTFESSTSPSWSSLDLEVKRHVLMMFKEMLNNILRHASATHVQIELNFKEKHLQLRVKDDGVGFTPSSPSTGRGLASLRSRAAAIGGKFTLESKPGSGTHVCLEADITRSSD
jgi:signal transduction histidine kinase